MIPQIYSLSTNAIALLDSSALVSSLGWRCRSVFGVALDRNCDCIGVAFYGRGRSVFKTGDIGSVTDGNTGPSLRPLYLRREHVGRSCAYICRFRLEGSRRLSRSFTEHNRAFIDPGGI